MQKGRGFYQKVQPGTEKKSEFESILARFATASEKRHDSTDATLRNQQASIHNIEQQIGKILRLFNECLLGIHASNTELNPKAHIKAVTTRSGKISTPLILLTHESSNV